MLLPYFLAALSFLSLPALASVHHASGHLHERHAALSARVSAPRRGLSNRSVRVRCPAKVPGAKALQRAAVLSTSQLSSVMKNAATASFSWEVGTHQMALLELNAPEIFLYNSTDAIPPTITSNTLVSDVFDSVDAVLAQKPAGIPTFFSDKAAGDPASVGIAFAIRNWTIVGSKGSSKYATALKQQLDYLLNDVDRAPNGAISQRAPPQKVQLWADFMSMVPPFISYYGALQNDRSLVEQGYQQLAAYHETLYDNDAGMLKHILLGATSVQDPNHWATGNGWGVNGMLRVLRIIQLSSFASSMTKEQDDLVSWASTILSNVWKHQQDSGALLNYMDLDPSATFPDASGTALLAACTFRLAAIVFGTPNAPDVNVAAAEKARQWVTSQIGSDGWLNSVVDPYNWHKQGTNSPEAQSFIIMLQAAYRDFYASNQGYY